MNTRLLNRLGALAIVVSMTTLGYALGGPARPGPQVAGIGQESAAPSPRRDRADVSMPFFSFGKRTGAGAPR